MLTHSSGSCPVSSEVMNIFARGVDIVFFISDSIPANTTHQTNVGPMLGGRRRR